MDEYTPSEDEMRHAYWLTRMLDHHADVNAAFDRFLARVRRDAAAEHRATRAEAQSAIRGRAVVIYRERAREAEAQNEAWAQQYDFDMGQEVSRAEEAETRIRAVEDALDDHGKPTDRIGGLPDAIRRALDA